MPLVNNKVGDEGRAGAVADGKALVDSLMRVSCSKYEATLCYIWPLIINAASSECRNTVSYLLASKTTLLLRSSLHVLHFEMQFHLPRG